MTGKYSHLFKDPDIKRWYDNMCRGSKVTADVSIRRLGAVCTYCNITPKELVERGRSDGQWLYNFAMDLVTKLEAEGKAGSYIESNLKVVRSWLNHNGVEFRRKIKIRGADDTPTLRGNRTLNNDQLRTLFLDSPPQTRCICVLIEQAGLRPEVVGSYEATDGLRIGDLPEMKIEGENITFLNIPTLVVVRRELSKAGHQYFTFLAREGCEYLQEYLLQRIRSGETLDSSTPLIVPKVSKKQFLRTAMATRLVRKRLRECWIRARPYDLRHTFATQLMLAEGKGLILRDYRTFFMGHKGDIENRYTTNKQSLPEKVVEDMRASFARSQEFLQSEGSFQETQRYKDEAYTRVLILAGFTEKEINNNRMLELSEEQIMLKARDKIISSIFGDAKEQKLVPLDALEKYLVKGWRCDHIIESRGQAVISIPTRY
ncbi:MAG: site-specific integrase [Thaumarchaeota archaeon]|nr:site-specific integrase [Nitrososphaerota archaeon]MCL5317272.1 site-specific integrase [Nitrososphaerota archaeon]